MRMTPAAAFIASHGTPRLEGTLMPAAKPIRRYTRSQRALLLIKHYGKSRVGVPLGAFVLLIASVMTGAILAMLFSFLVAYVLARLYPGKFIMERDFLNVWVPCMMLFAVAMTPRLMKFSESWEVKLLDAMTRPPPAIINEILPDEELLVRASNPNSGAAGTVLLRPASECRPDPAPHTLLCPSTKNDI